jgi:hypothetical protein
MISSTHSAVHSFAARESSSYLLRRKHRFSAWSRRSRASTSVHAQAVLKSNNAKEQVLELAQTSTGLQDSQLSELLVGIEAFWAERERRNRYIHDEW